MAIVGLSWKNKPQLAGELCTLATHNYLYTIADSHISRLRNTKLSVVNNSVEHIKRAYAGKANSQVFPQDY